ncbi:hypothetical protein RHS01_05861 [Rhizoctonia solani]|uniref:Uncharacterized protein n=1 Tax=Rhizoctonia solani TaxID=456999 RepID=A0A8H7M4D1_9AGAM|nr:hypothetical protein RHS01_05861 [Rhizoctonia solani]
MLYVRQQGHGTPVPVQRRLAPHPPTRSPSQPPASPTPAPRVGSPPDPTHPVDITPSQDLIPGTGPAHTHSSEIQHLRARLAALERQDIDILDHTQDPQTCITRPLRATPSFSALTSHAILALFPHAYTSILTTPALFAPNTFLDAHSTLTPSRTLATPTLPHPATLLRGILFYFTFMLFFFTIDHSCPAYVHFISSSYIYTLYTPYALRSHISLVLVFRRAVIPGKQAPARQALIPPIIIQIFKSGLRKYVPMPMLTTRYRQLNSDSSRSDLDVIKWNSRGQALVKDAANLSDAGELFMSPDDWVDGWKTWLCDFNLWLRYDIMVRKRWIDEDFDPGTFQEGIYKMVDRDLAMAARGSVSQPAPGDSGPPSSHHNQTTRFRTWGPVPGANNSYPYGPPPIAPQPTPQISNHIPHSFVLYVSATFSMAPKDVPPLDASAVPMSALSVASTATMHKIAQIDPRKIVTPLIPAAWHSCLEGLKLLHIFSDVPAGLTHGFRLGASRALSSTSTPPNHKSAQDSPSIIDSHISKELALGCYSGPFSHTSLFNLIGHFRSAPLGLVSKPSSPGEFRMVQDFSFSHSKGQNNSVNSEIDVDEFPCIWGFFDNVVQVLLDLPEGSSAATFDVDAAYRCIPIHPDDQPSTIISWRNQLYIDHCAPFGALAPTACLHGVATQCS